MNDAGVSNLGGVIRRSKERKDTNLSANWLPQGIRNECRPAGISLCWTAQ